ncbi:MAG: sodium:alanine symporter family protein [Peptoniphilaceae bacterium]|nr:sodium:alanine symporter family protein [Peptoniphilaceae bacterium]
MLDLVKYINSLLWGFPMMIVLAGFGVFSTLYLGFPQFRRFPYAIKKVFGDIFNKKDSKEGSMSSFQSLATAVAAQVGTGNIGGVGTAIVSGGPGAVFWMRILAILGMSTISVEAILAQKYRTKRNGELVGGPAYYLSLGLKEKGHKNLGKILAVVFASLIIVALGFIGNMVQSNSISDSLNIAFGINKILAGLFIGAIAMLVFVGGMKRIAKFAEFVVPFMAIFYIIGSIVLLINLREMLIPVLKAIFQAAFSSEAVLGGTAGYAVKLAIRFGFARGLFSNEAGMGSTPNSHAVADVAHPVEQGMVAMVGVFFDTIIICSVTSLIVLTSGANNSGAEGVNISMTAFSQIFGINGARFLSVALTFFAFTTIIGWYYFGESNIKYLFKNKLAINIYRTFVFIFLVLGAAVKVDLVWELADMFNGLMVIPNIIGLFILIPLVKDLYRDYDKKIDENNLNYFYKYE